MKKIAVKYENTRKDNHNMFTDVWNKRVPPNGRLVQLVGRRYFKTLILHKNFIKENAVKSHINF